MKKTQIAVAVACAFITSLAVAETTSTATSTRSTTTSVESANPAYSTSRIEQETDAHGNVTKRSQTYQRSEPATGGSSSSSSISVESPDGTTNTVEKETRSDDAYGGATEIEKQTKTTTKRY